MPMVPIMQILVFAGLVRSLAATTGPIFYAVGQPQIETKWQAFRLIILATLIYPLTVRFGLIGTSIVVLINIFIATISFCVTVLGITKCTIKDFMKGIFLPLLNTTIMISILFFIKTKFISIQYLQIFLLIGIGTVSYYLIAILFDKLLDYGIIKTVKEIIIK
jgi:O-antigen/teichoic acid export membrane protein